MAGAEPHRRLDHDDCRVDLVCRQIPRWRDDEAAGANRHERSLRARSPILVRHVDMFDREIGKRGVDRRGSEIALTRIVEADVPMQGSWRRVRNRRKSWLPLAAWPQRPLSEL